DDYDHRASTGPGTDALRGCGDLFSAGLGFLREAGDCRCAARHSGGTGNRNLAEFSTCSLAEERPRGFCKWANFGPIVCAVTVLAERCGFLPAAVLKGCTWAGSRLLDAERKRCGARQGPGRSAGKGKDRRKSEIRFGTAEEHA